MGKKQKPRAVHMKSKWNSTCGFCKTEIKVGDNVCWVKGTSAIHDECEVAKRKLSTSPHSKSQALLAELPTLGLPEWFTSSDVARVSKLGLASLSDLNPETYGKDSIIVGMSIDGCLRHLHRNDFINAKSEDIEVWGLPKWRPWGADDEDYRWRTKRTWKYSLKKGDEV